MAFLISFLVSFCVFIHHRLKLLDTVLDKEKIRLETADGYSLDLGSGSFVPGFEDQVIGRSVGETFDINVTFPESYAEELASKDAVFEVTVNELKEGVPVEINDEIAKKMGLENLDELKKSMRDSQEQELSVFTRMRTKREQ